MRLLLISNRLNLVEELNKKRKFIADNLDEKGDSIRALMQHDLEIIRTTLAEEEFKDGLAGVDMSKEWPLTMFDQAFNQKLESYLEAYKKAYQIRYNKAVAAREGLAMSMESNKELDYT